MSRSSWCFPSRQATSARAGASRFSRWQHRDLSCSTLRRAASWAATVADGSKPLPIRYTALTQQHPNIAQDQTISEPDKTLPGSKRPLVRRVWLSHVSQLSETAHTPGHASEVQPQHNLSRQESEPPYKNVSKTARRGRASRTSTKPATGDLEPIRRETPSEALISALESVGCKVNIARPKWRAVDLSDVDPMEVTRLDKEKVHGIKREQRQLRSRLSYASIVADYIRHVYPIMENTQSGAIGDEHYKDDLDKVLLSVFDDRAHGPLAYLSTRGYSAEDVVTWAWILTSPTPHKAARRLEAAEAWNTKNSSSLITRVPLFILLFILRQGNINAAALRILMKQARGLLNRIDTYSEHASTGKAAQSNEVQRKWKPSGDHTSVIILIVRLIRHARAVWPQCLLPIATLATSSLGFSAATGNSENLDWQKSQHLTFVFNRFLSLLAHPCNVEPYHSVSMQQRSQFHLLREMSRFKPPLAVTREGYQAVTRVQVAHRKTLAEREWAHFKSPSWPPWKEEKLGIDFDRGNEGSRSRAIESINHMRTAGYAPTGWDRLARVYAGWDTDGTPTIQKRVFLPKPSAIRTAPDITTPGSMDPPVRVDIKGTNYENDRIWAARIRTTRTLREAWACFLSYQDQYSGHPHMGVYFAMTEKLVARKAHGLPSAKHSQEAMPGDGNEVYPEPSSPRDVTYVRTEPPSLERFLDDMLAQNIKPNVKILCLVLPHASSFKSGLHYLSQSTLRERHINALTLHPISQMDHERRKHLSEIGNELFTAFMAFLGKFSVLDSPPEDGSPIRMAQLFPVLIPSRETANAESPSPETNVPDKIQHSRALMHAVHLMQLRESRYVPAWHRLLSTLSMDRVKAGVPGRPISITKQRILAWCEIAEVLAWMRRANIPVELQTLEIVCSALVKVIRSVRLDPDSSEQGLRIAARVKGVDPHPIANTLESLSGLVTEGMRFIKSHFDKLALHNDMSPIMLSETSGSADEAAEAPLMLPNLYAVPSPSLLHSLVRLFGLVGDQELLVRLLQWMNFFAEDVRLAAEERIGGMRQLRHAVIAARVFLEGHLDSLEAVVSISDERSSECSVQGLHDEKTGNASGSSDAFVKDARTVVEGTEILAPWPSDEEVRLYIDIGNQKL